MKKLSATLFLFLITAGSCFAQPDKLYIPHDDGSESTTDITCMYIGMKNEIAYSYQGEKKILHIKTNNGKIFIDSISTDENKMFPDYFVIPDTLINICVEADIQRYLGKNRYDTVHVESFFTPLYPPKTKVIVKKDAFRKDGVIILSVINNETGKPISGRYKIGRLADLKVFDNNHKYIESMPLLANEIIDFSMWHLFSKRKIKPGYIIEVAFLIRDTETDLLSETEELTYSIK